MKCNQCIRIFDVIGEGFNSPIETPVLLERAARAITEQLSLKGCLFRLLSRDQKLLDDVASYGLSERFLNKGPVDAERSVTEALAGQTVLVEDCASDARIQYPAEHAEEGIVSCLTVPLKARGQVLGVMRMFTAEQRVFLPLELRVAETVASFASRAVTHCMFHKTVDRVTDSIRTILDPSEVLNRIVEVISDELRAKGATVHLFDRPRETLVPRAFSGLSLRYLNTVAGEVIEAALPRLEEGALKIFDPDEEEVVSDPEAFRQEGIGSQLLVPLRVRQQTLGVLSVYTNLPYQFSDDEVFFMEAIADQCALAIENARMYTALEDQYSQLVDDFQLWFERPYPGVGTTR